MHFNYEMALLWPRRRACRHQLAVGILAECPWLSIAFAPICSLPSPPTTNHANFSRSGRLRRPHTCHQRVSFSLAVKNQRLNITFLMSYEQLALMRIILSVIDEIMFVRYALTMWISCYSRSSKLLYLHDCHGAIHVCIVRMCAAMLNTYSRIWCKK